MKALITGGAGFLGQRLARKLLERPALTGLTLIDQVEARFDDPRVRAVAGDIADPDVLRKVLAPDTDSVFHLAAIVSAQAEQDFDLGYRVNVDATRALLELCRRSGKHMKLVFASSAAVFGGPLPATLSDDTILTPQSSYGTQKAIGELLVTDYSRKGFVDGRSLRLPTIVVRPGKPNRAASSFASGIIREPLGGTDSICPVGPEVKVWLSSPATVIDNILAGHDADASRFSHTRSISVPGLSITVGEMVDTLRGIAGEQVAARVKWQRDPAIARIVESWPPNFDTVFGRSLGMRSDPDFAGIVRQYIAETK
jgi:nucleoside-diphosphate-sugar epimerase